MKPDLTIMMVDDEEEILHAQSITLTMAGYTNIIAVKDSRQVLDILGEQPVEVILLDLAMPYVSGEDLLHTIRESFPYIPVIIITATDYVDTAVSCMKSGALDYMVKPIEKSRLVSGIQNAIEIHTLRRRFEDLKDHLIHDTLNEPQAFSSMITENRTMRGIFHYLEIIGKTDLTILVTGETGTGKELIAGTIHTISRREGTFVPINIAGLDDTMFSDTLFGHKKGAFTGASESRGGLLQEASDGTLLIDEIGDLQPTSQIKLLRLLEHGEYYPLGSDIRRVNTSRIILASQQSPKELLQSNTFRKDLYYRIATHHVHLPPLRERKEDIPLLLHHFIDQACTEFERPRSTIPTELYSLLNCYHFPGNIRELRSMVWNAVSKQKGRVLSLEPFKDIIGREYESAPMDGVRSQEHPQTGGHRSEERNGPKVWFGERLPTLTQATELLITEALDRTQGNLSLAAELLGISRQALSKRLKRMGK